MRRKIENSGYCSLRMGCRVTGRSSEVPPTVQYVDSLGSRQEIQGQWLVGADGKTGVVRKHFLEPTAGIRQQAGVYPYEGVWVASNLKMTLPTRQTHPDFLLWKLGYTPEEVYDLFWPAGWHFCSPPGKPTATGRFGPRADRTWRHEFRVDDESSGPIYSEELLWEHLMPSITLERDDSRGHEFGCPVEYPRDCITILRCRPFKFVHKCVNRWYDKRTLLIGDAAHVFPPFAGQGVASGVRDAHQLAWRLALLLEGGGDPAHRPGILDSWARERRRSVDDAALMSKAMGTICNNQPTFGIMAMTKAMGVLHSIPPLRRYEPIGIQERSGFCSVDGGFFMKDYNGGAHLAQIHVRSSLPSRPSVLSDVLLQQSGTIFTLLVIGNGDAKQRALLHLQTEAAITAAALSPRILSSKSIILYNPQDAGLPLVSDTASGLDGKPVSTPEVFSPVPTSEIKVPLAPGYNSASYLGRLGRSARFVIARPDLFVFACAKNEGELIHCLGQLKKLSS